MNKVIEIQSDIFVCLEQIEIWTTKKNKLVQELANARKEEKDGQGV